VTTTKVQLDPPVTDDDGNKVTEAVSVVEFTAADGAGRPVSELMSPRVLIDLVDAIVSVAAHMRAG